MGNVDVTDTGQDEQMSTCRDRDEQTSTGRLPDRDGCPWMSVTAYRRKRKKWKKHRKWSKRRKWKKRRKR